MRITLDDIEGAVCAYFKLTREKLHESARNCRGIFRPRQIIWFLARELADPPLSFPRLGRAYDRDHATVMMGVRTIRRLMAVKPLLAEHVQACREGAIAMNAARASAMTVDVSREELVWEVEPATGEAISAVHQMKEAA